MKYALLIYSTPEFRQELGPELDSAHDEWAAFYEARKAAGVYVAAKGLSHRSAELRSLLPESAVAPRAERATG